MDNHDKCCHNPNQKKSILKNVDYILIPSLIVITLSILAMIFGEEYIKQNSHLYTFTNSNYQLIKKMWWGLALGVLAVGLLNIVPRKYIYKVLGNDRGLKGVVRATIAGVMLDLCSHGILLVGMKLYREGVSLGQVMAFLIASPWNSLSLTIVMVSLIGLKWTLAFILLSMLIAIISGLIFQKLVANNILPDNPNYKDILNEYDKIKETAKEKLKEDKENKKNNKVITLFNKIIIDSIKESKMIFRWIFFGVVLASLVRTFVSADNFQTYFGPTMYGLLATIIIATIIEVCSEGSVPLASDLLNIAGAPGNTFAFLMTGVSTDYTEILSLKETTKSYKIALFLPLVTVPQVVFVGWIINAFT